MSPNPLAKAALWYAQHGWFVLPIRPRQKTPLTPHGVKDASNDPLKVRAWWTRWPHANIGLSCGDSGLLALDDDDNQLHLLGLPPSDLHTLTSLTHRGAHLLYRLPPHLKIGNTRGQLPHGIDVRGHGGYILLPPSVHPSGHRYTWKPGLAPHQCQPQQLPPSLLALITYPAPNPPEQDQNVIAKNRNTTLTSIAGRLRRHGLDVEELTARLLKINAERCQPPLDQTEVRRIAHSVARYPTQQPNKSKDKQADVIYRLASHKVTVFCGDDGAPYCRTDDGARRTLFRLRSKEMRGFLAALHYEETGSIPGGQAVEDVLRLLEYEATRAVEDVFIRVGGHEDKIYVDMGDARWRAVEIDVDGWRMLDQCPVNFKRVRGMLPLGEPQPGLSIKSLRSFVNIRDDDWPLFVATLVSYLLPKGPFPVLALQGPQGSAKSMTQTVIKALLDPNVAPLRGEPENIRDLMIAVNNNWISSFDNLSRITHQVSDALCRIATGGGYSTRMLYADDDELLINVARPITFNSITDVITRSDLLDRSVTLRLNAISPTARTPEAIFRSEFERLRGPLLGALLDLAVHALRHRYSIVANSLPRMADFARIGMAIARQIGLSPHAWLDLYQQRSVENALALISDSSLVQPISELLESAQGEWRGSAAELLAALQTTQTGQQLNARIWPRSGRGMSALLWRIAPDLETARVATVDVGKGNGKRFMILRRAQ